MKTTIAYNDPAYFSAFPCVTRSDDDTLFVTFRRAPQRQPHSNHLDSESIAAKVTSKDGGETWSDVGVLYEEPGDVGVQDPSVTRLKEGRLMSNFFSWEVMKREPFQHQVLGTFITASSDGGETWSKARKVEVPGNPASVATSEPLIELSNGDLLLPLYGRNAGCFVMRSTDGGETWTDQSVVAHDPFGNVKLCEPALCETRDGRILCLMRETSPGYLYQSESSDGGRTWSQVKNLDVWGFPPNLLNLRDGRILLSYGYRRPPYGVRACLSEDQGRTWDIRREIVIRDDGWHGDLGYPSSIELADGQILTLHYFHEPATKEGLTGTYHSKPGTRFIAATRFEV